MGVIPADPETQMSNSALTQGVNAVNKAETPDLLSPAQQRKIRGMMMAALVRVTPDAEKAMRGEIKWSTQQVQLYKMFAAHAVPLVSGKQVEVNHNHRNLDQLSRADIEAIALGEQE